MRIGDSSPGRTETPLLSPVAIRYVVALARAVMAGDVVIGLGRVAAKRTNVRYNLLFFSTFHLHSTTPLRHHSHIHKLLHHHHRISCHLLSALPCMASPTWHYADVTIIQELLCHHRHVSSCHHSALLCLAAPPWHFARATVITSLHAFFPPSPSAKTSQPRTTPFLGSGGSCAVSSESSLVTSSLNGSPANLTSQPLRISESEHHPWSLHWSRWSWRCCHAPAVARSELKL